MEWQLSKKYSGRRFRYGLSQTLANDNNPPFWLIGSEKKDSKFIHGTIDYSRELTLIEINKYVLTPIEIN